MVREEEAGAFRPAKLLLGHADIFSSLPSDKPVLDLACGEGQNGLFLAARGVKVFLADRSEEALLKVRKTAEDMGVSVEVRQVDFEKEGVNPLGHERYAGIIVFRYLHRPLIPHIKGAIIGGGLLMYETYTIDQRRFGRPRSPRILKPDQVCDPSKRALLTLSRQPLRGQYQRSQGLHASLHGQGCFREDQ